MTHRNAPAEVLALLRSGAEEMPMELLEKLADLAEGAAGRLAELAAVVRAGQAGAIPAAAELAQLLGAEVSAVRARQGGAA